MKSIKTHENVWCIIDERIWCRRCVRSESKGGDFFFSFFFPSPSFFFFFLQLASAKRACVHVNPCQLTTRGEVWRVSRTNERTVRMISIVLNFLIGTHFQTWYTRYSCNHTIATIAATATTTTITTSIHRVSVTKNNRAKIWNEKEGRRNEKGGRGRKRGGK